MTIVVLNKHTPSTTFSINCTDVELLRMKQALELVLRGMPGPELKDSLELKLFLKMQEAVRA